MKIKDSTIICLLIFLWLSVMCGVFGAENEISRLEEQIDTLYTAQYEVLQDVADIHKANDSQDERMADIEHYNRVQDYRLQMHNGQLADNAKMFTDLINSVGHLEEYMRSLPDNAWGLELSEQDIRDISALVYLEAGGQGCSYELKKAIATVILNQMVYYGLDAQRTIYRSGAFSPASRVRSTTPSSSCVMAVREVLENGGTLPKGVIAFQLGSYHSFGHRYCKIQNVYFTSV